MRILFFLQDHGLQDNQPEDNNNLFKDKTKTRREILPLSLLNMYTSKHLFKRNNGPA